MGRPTPRWSRQRARVYREVALRLSAHAGRQISHDTMTSPSMTTEAVFVAVVLAVAGMFIHAVLKTVHSREHPNRGGFGVLMSVLLFWLVVPAVLANQGVLDRYSPLPAPALVLIGVITFSTVVLALSAFGARLAAGIPVAGLVGYQVFRVPLEWVLHQLWDSGSKRVTAQYGSLPHGTSLASRCLPTSSRSIFPRRPA